METIETKESMRERLLRRERLSGSEILLRTLLLEGVECVFGYPGGAVLYIYDAMHGNPAFKHVLTRHEQGAVHAADGYARSTGKTGVCLATSGPGATNLVTGIATAHMDSVPLVVITGNVATTLIGTDAFQEADIIGITQPVAKHGLFVRHAEDLAGTIREAFAIANAGRPGPVIVDIPKDVSAAVVEFVYPERIELPPSAQPAANPDGEAIRALAAAIRLAERPLLLSGGGVIQSGAAEALARLARGAGIPVTTTLMGMGALPAGDPLWLGMPGMHGTYAANQAILQCDLLVAVGARFDDRVTMRLDGFAQGAAIAHVDIDAAEIGKLVQVDYPVQGDARLSLEALNRELEIAAVTAQADVAQAGTRIPEAARSAWLARVSAWKSAYPLRYRDSDDVLKPQYVIEMIARTTGGDAIVTTDVGQHQMWAAQYGRFDRPRSLLTSGGLGTMGFGFPSAIGAQIGNPDRVVVSVNGDGGMQMCAQELAVCAIHKIPVKIVVINNRTLGMIKQWQELVYEGRFSHIDLGGSPDFVLLAEAYGVKGLRAESKREAEAVWAEALATDGPVLIDFVVDKDELVYPMVPQGKRLQDMLLGDSDTDKDTDTDSENNADEDKKEGAR
ncbi:biosynthetic-type acetolactate synthase large subunit [Cohnella sp. JJ-181]|uniref:biosynthetic-type acetolactate synthase large subunit n=1 Tax=Cohnella rhizoplanae TaxID=2974897 RepID=UPI0022FF7D3E|nr:biosynthetic-type acetolactate synthase large subunit [Cohnella sp. JJ-181]CAI6084522.1 Acetolactate synthase large subunit [Cohnella sp. JJ-181]